MKFKPQTEPSFVNADFNPDFWKENPYLVGNAEGEIIGVRPDAFDPAAAPFLTDIEQRYLEYEMGVREDPEEW